MNRIVASGVVLAAGLGLSACSGRSPSEAATSSGGKKGQYGVSFYVNVSRPTGGTIRSADGKINCGTPGGPNGACAPVAYGWAETVTLMAIPDAGQYFQNWAADCGPGLAPTCTLDTATSGLDKWVAAVFNPPDRLGHGRIDDPSLHAPLFFDFLASAPAAPRCNTCHGADYQGTSFVPSCNACHAAAGWADWKQSCSFCHGRKDATTKAGYAFAAHPEWAAPPDDVNGRLTGVDGPAVGAHQSHVTASAIRGPLACTECHVVPATAIHVLNRTLDLPFGDLATRNNTLTPSWSPATLTCASTYCHGATLAGGTLKDPVWSATDHLAAGCGACHGFPPPTSSHAGVASQSTACHSCHPDTVDGAGAIDLAKGKHIDGTVDGSGACNACHGFPPATGAHARHWGLTAVEGTSSYGDLSTLQTRYPAASPTAAPQAYAFGCGNCHPVDAALHRNGTVDVDLAPAGTASLKARNSAAAGYDAATRTCSGVYCHSGGQAAPVYVTTPDWTSATRLGCAGCHANPPAYASGGAGTATANSHLDLAEDGYEYGHFLGMPGPTHSSQHGASPATGVDAAPITCQTCHYDTTDPTSTGPSGFYWLDTTGNYALPGGDPSRIDWGWQAGIQCGSCHNSSGGPPLAQGRVLPLRHVNGVRDVVFDPRTSLPAIDWLPASPNRPTAPYWITGGSLTIGWPAGVTWNGTTVSFGLSGATYDPVAKTCASVACHMSQGSTPSNPLVWGDPYVYTGSKTCNACHPM